MNGKAFAGQDSVSTLRNILGLEEKSFSPLAALSLLKNRFFRVCPLLAALSACLFLEWHFHVRQGISVVYTHFFYIPIIWAALFYDLKGGLCCSLFLAAIHNIGGLGQSSFEPLARGLMMVAVGTSLGYIDKLLVLANRKSAESEEIYRVLMDRSGIASGIVDTDSGKFLYANPQLIESLQLSSMKDIGNRLWQDFVHPCDQKKMKEVVDDFSNTGRNPVKLECRLLGRHGSMSHVIGNLAALSPSSAMVSFVDVTEIKRLEEKTEDNLALFAGIYENAPCALILTTWDDRIIHHNRKFREIFRIPEGVELIGCDLGSLIAGGDDGRIQEEFRELTRIAEALNGFEGEVVRKTWTGEDLSLLLKTVPMKIAGERNCLVMYQDISEIKALAEENRGRLEMFRVLFEHSPAALALVDEREVVLDASTSFLETFRIEKKEDVLGEPLRSVVLGSDDEELKGEFDDIYRSRLMGECVRLETFRRRKGGALFPVRVTEVPVTYIGKRAALNLYLDLTEQKDREHELENAFQHLSDAMENLVVTVSRIIEARDPYTSGHQKRVAELSRRIAREMGLGQNEVRGIYFGGLLHDAGKIQIPSEILNKSSKLNDIEMNLIRTHAGAGADILGQVPFPWPIVDMIRHHHERLDGTGYPDRLKGEALSTAVRIIAVADVVEAMMNHRPYREALGQDKALDEIREGAGTLFDPEVVEVCVRLFEENSFSFEPSSYSR